MGMLATAINSLALRTSLTKLGVETVVLSAIAMPQICESFSQRKAIAYMNQGKVVIFAGGTGNPFLPLILLRRYVQQKLVRMFFLKEHKLMVFIQPIPR